MRGGLGLDGMLGLWRGAMMPMVAAALAACQPLAPVEEPLADLPRLQTYSHPVPGGAYFSLPYYWRVDVLDGTVGHFSYHFSLAPGATVVEDAGVTAVGRSVRCRLAVTPRLWGGLSSYSYDVLRGSVDREASGEWDGKEVRHLGPPRSNIDASPILMRLVAGRVMPSVLAAGGNYAYLANAISYGAYIQLDQYDGFLTCFGHEQYGPVFDQLAVALAQGIEARPIDPGETRRIEARRPSESSFAAPIIWNVTRMEPTPNLEFGGYIFIMVRRPIWDDVAEPIPRASTPYCTVTLGKRLTDKNIAKQVGIVPLTALTMVGDPPKPEDMQPQQRPPSRFDDKKVWMKIHFYHQTDDPIPSQGVKDEGFDERSHILYGAGFTSTQRLVFVGCHGSPLYLGDYDALTNTLAASFELPRATRRSLD